GGAAEDAVSAGLSDAEPTPAAGQPDRDLRQCRQGSLRHPRPRVPVPTGTAEQVSTRTRCRRADSAACTSWRVRVREGPSRSGVSSRLHVPTGLDTNTAKGHIPAAIGEAGAVGAAPATAV